MSSTWEMGKDCFWLGRLAAAVAKSWFMATELKLQVALARETVDIMNERLAQRVNLHLALAEASNRPRRIHVF